MASIFGKPNVGKSTIINKILKQKICITSRKPQTTRYRMLGIFTDKNYQIAFIDTPGLHKENQKTMNKVMNKTAAAATKDVEIVYFVIDAQNWDHLDENALAKLIKNRNDYTKYILIINKIDRIKQKTELLQLIQQTQAKFNFTETIPVSAKTGANIDQITTTAKKYLYESEHCFPEDSITDKTAKFVVSELIREKIIRYTGNEIPYQTNVTIESFKVTSNNLYEISALITIEKESQKGIIIGNKGKKLKIIGQAARMDIEKTLGGKVLLNLWVKTQSGWRDRKETIMQLNK